MESRTQNNPDVWPVELLAWWELKKLLKGDERLDMANIVGASRGWQWKPILLPLHKN